MKNKVIVYIVLALMLGLVAGYLISKPKKNIPQDIQSNSAEYGYGGSMGQGRVENLNRENCLADDCLLVDDLEYPAGELPKEVQNVLDEAINDEYKALATYQKVIEEFGMVRPFSMIVGAEEQHIASLKSIYDKYELDIPENNWASKITIPATLKESCQVGVEAEIENAALYREELLPVVKDFEDISLVFTNLMNASQDKHLPAFENCN